MFKINIYQERWKKSPPRSSHQFLIMGSNRANNVEITPAAEPQCSFFYSKIQDTTFLKINVTEKTGVSSCFLKWTHSQRKYLPCISVTDGDQPAIPQIRFYWKDLRHLSVGPCLPEQGLCLQSKVTHTTACLSYLRVRWEPHILTDNDFWVSNT